MIEQTEFAELVRDAFAHLHDPAHLRGHALTRLLGSPGQPLSANVLRQALLDTAEQLRPPPDAPQHSTAWRRYRYLRLRYAEGASHESIARDLLVSTRQARRDHLDALESMASILWERSLAVQSMADESTTEATGAQDVPGADGQATLDAELTKTRFESASGPTDMREVLAGVIEITGRLAARLAGSIEASLPTTLPPAAVDRTILRQTLLSLLSYAVEVRPGAYLVLEAADRGEVVDLRITAAQTRRPLTDREPRRSRSSDSEAFAPEAAAMLSAGQTLARLHGVEVAVDELDAGCLTLEVRVPVARPFTVLVVDDNPDVSRLFERYLHGTEYRLMHAETWQRALRLAHETRPDAIILDVMMPSQDGWDILRELRARPDTRSMPVIVCSVLPERSLALAMGVTDFLPKPVTRQGLLDALRRCQPFRPAERRGSS